MRARLRFALFGVLSLLGGLPATRVAADARSCAASHAEGQREVKAGQLTAALELFKTCGADQSCPAPVRRECVELFGFVESVLPTLIFAVTDEHGNDITNVRVFTAGELIADSLDGRPLAVDPGERGFLLELPSGRVLTADVLVREGEKNRILPVSAPSEDLIALPVRRELAAAPEKTAAEAEPASRAVWVASGIGGAALGTWAIAALVGRSQQVNLVNCSPRCDTSMRSTYDAMKRNYLLADVSLGIAAASAGVAIAVFLTSRPWRDAARARSASSPALSLAPVVLGREGALLAIARPY